MPALERLLIVNDSALRQQRRRWHQILALSNTKPGYARTGSFITTLHEPQRSVQAGQRRRWH
jgi:hypothetical protein